MSTKFDRGSTSPGSTRPRCPVCHETVYSRAGIHPQCAARQAEPPKGRAKPGTPNPVVPPPAADGLNGPTVIVAPLPGE